MNTNVNDFQISHILIIIICSILLLILLLTITVIVIIKKRKKKVKRIKIDDEFLDTLFLGLGGKSNIKEMLIDNGRLKFSVIDLKLLNKEFLDKVSQSGVFITGNFVKLLFKYDAMDIKKAIEGKKKK